jgi:hypothetical protein
MATYGLPPIAGQQSTQQPAQPASGLAAYSVEQLLALRAAIDEQLPNRTLKAVNLEQELVIQLQLAQKLQKETLEDEKIPANQKAQVLNSVASALQMLGKVQIDLYDSERLKKLEQIMIQTLTQLPIPQQEAFLQAYETQIGDMQ